MTDRRARDLVRLAIDSYNTGLRAPRRGRFTDAKLGGALFSVFEIERAGTDVITRGELLGFGNVLERRSARLTLLWQFDASGSVADIRVLDRAEQLGAPSARVG
jgi:hypothetical protein